jgi:hypothetical protein
MTTITPILTGVAAHIGTLRRRCRRIRSRHTDFRLRDARAPRRRHPA